MLTDLARGRGRVHERVRPEGTLGSRVACERRVRPGRALKANESVGVAHVGLSLPLL
jgi:hypothetical protein